MVAVEPRNTASLKVVRSRKFFAVRPASVCFEALVIAAAVTMVGVVFAPSVHARSSFSSSSSRSYSSSSRSSSIRSSSSSKSTTSKSTTSKSTTSKPSSGTTKVTAKQPVKSGFSTTGYKTSSSYQPRFRGYNAPIGSTVYYQRDYGSALDFLPWYFLLTHDSHQQAVVTQPDGQQKTVKADGVDTMYVVNWIVMILLTLGIIGG